MSRKTRKIMNGQYKFKGKKGSEKKKKLTIEKLFCHCCHASPKHEKNKILGQLALTQLDNNKNNFSKTIKKTLSN
jgi:hypothetical protein